MDKRTEEKKTAFEMTKDEYSRDLERRIKDFKDRHTLADSVLTNHVATIDNFNAWRNPLYELVAISERAIDRMNKQNRKEPSGYNEEGNIELETYKFIFSYMIALLNFLESIVYVQQRQNSEFRGLFEASKNKDQRKFKKMLRELTRESQEVKRITPKDIENLKWIGDYIEHAREIDGND